MGRPIIPLFGQGNATGCASRSSKISAGGSTGSGARIGSTGEKLKQVLDAARADAARDLSQATLPPGFADTLREQGQPTAAGLRKMSYERAICEVPLDLDIQEIEMEKLSPVVRSVIAHEGPIHRAEIVRRIGTLFGKQRVSPRIATAVKRALDLFADDAPDLWFTPEQRNAPIVRDRSAAPASLRKLDMIATSEIRAAIAIARQQNGSLRDDELARAVAGLLGLPKTSAEVRTLVRSLAA